MTDEFDEGFPEGLARFGVGCDDVHDGEDGEHGPYPDDLQGLEDHVLSSEPGKSFVPDGSQKLLDVWMSHELKTERSTYITYRNNLLKETVIRYVIHMRVMKCIY